MLLKEIIPWSLFAVMLISASCTKSPESDEAITGEAMKPLELTDTTEEYLIDTINSLLSWVGTKPTGRHNGIFRIKEGSIYLVNDTVVYGILKIDMTTVDILDLKDNDELYNKLLTHIKSEDLLDIKKYPTSEFELLKLKQLKREVKNKKTTYFTVSDPNFLVTGNLTLRDTTLKISFPARIDVRNHKLEGLARFNIDRTQWGIKYMNETDPVARAKDSFIHNKVNVGLTIIARKKPQNIF